MPQLTAEQLYLYQAGIKINFDVAYQRYNETANWNLIATELPTTLPIQNYAWLGSGVVVEELRDRPREQRVNEYEYTLADTIYKGRLNIKRKELEDDQYGLLKIRAEGVAEAATRHWNKLAYTGLVNGFTKFCYDGQYFFDVDHQSGDSPVQSNVTSSTFSDAALTVAEQQMMLYTDDKGEPLDVMPDTLVVGPMLARKASDIIQSDVIVVNVGDGAVGTGATAATNFGNYHKGKYRLLVNPRIRGAAQFNWFLLDTSKSIKPLVIQSRSDIPITTESDLTDPKAIMNEEFNFDVRGRYAQGYGMWQYAYGSNATS